MSEPNTNKKQHNPLVFTAKILLIVLVAELAVSLYVNIARADAGLSPLLESIMRLVIVGIGVLVIALRPGRDQNEPVEVVTAADSDEDEDMQKWPNIDELTRTSNERGLTISILELMALADRYGHKLSIGMVRVNGTESLDSDAADNTMINMAGLMTESLRMPDRIGRFRENVFMVLLPESDISGAAVVADRLMDYLGNPVTGDDSKAVSVQIGMTEFQRGEDLQSLLSRVESAVNDAANEGSGICIKHA
jgi:diguanylate cyclase (GGDEF)-like protein